MTEQCKLAAHWYEAILTYLSNYQTIRTGGRLTDITVVGGYFLLVFRLKRLADFVFLEIPFTWCKLSIIHFKKFRHFLRLLPKNELKTERGNVVSFPLADQRVVFE
jgi:hypothetical protein